MAGAGTYTGPALGALNNVLAPVMPYRAFGDTPDQARGIFHRTDAISFLYVPSTPIADAALAALARCTRSRHRVSTQLPGGNITAGVRLR